MYKIAQKQVFEGLFVSVFSTCVFWVAGYGIGGITVEAGFCKYNLGTSSRLILNVPCFR